METRARKLGSLKCLPALLRLAGKPCAGKNNWLGGLGGESLDFDFQAAFVGMMGQLKISTAFALPLNRWQMIRQF